MTIFCFYEFFLHQNADNCSNACSFVPHQIPSIIHTDATMASCCHHSGIQQHFFTLIHIAALGTAGGSDQMQNVEIAVVQWSK